MEAIEAQQIRFDGTVALWYSSHTRVDSRDWDLIEEFHGPYHPLLGYYKSDDPEVLRTQLHWMRRAGVDAIVYDCYGCGKLSLTDLPQDTTLQLLIDELSHQEHESRKLKLIIWLEKWASDPSLDDYRFALDFLREHLIHHDFYVRYQGFPLVVTYLNSYTDAVCELEWETTDFTLRRIRPYQTDVWSYLEQYPQQLKRQWMPVSAAFDPFLELMYMAKYVRKETNPDREKIYRESRQHAALPDEGRLFEKQLLRARQGDPEFIFISGWNDWQYQCQIEPAVEYEFLYVDMAARLLGREAETLPYREPALTR
ncbi:MAG: glycoside hydrolase family 71/99 protein [Armatimonadota bacterium]